MIKKFLAFVICSAMLTACLQPVVLAREEAPQLYIDGVPVALEHPCVVEGDAVYLPLVETFFKMGVYMSWDDKEKCWFGEGDNGEIRITADSMTADVDWVDIELPYPAKEINGVMMIPLYLAEDALRTEPGTYDKEKNRIDLKFPSLGKAYEPEFSIASIEAQLPKDGDFFKPEWIDIVNAQGAVGSSENKGSKYMKTEIADVEDMPFETALSIETLPYENGTSPAAIYDIQRVVVVDNETFEAGDVGLMTFWARATKITDEAGVAVFRPAYEEFATVGFSKAQGATVSIGSEWKKYYLVMYNSKDTMPKNKSQLTFSVGAKPQTIEIADMHMYNFKDKVSIETLRPESKGGYKGIEDDALWRKEAYRRIEKYRKNDMVVYVKDESGNPIQGARVTADMAATDNEFMFGQALCENEVSNLYEDSSKVGAIRAEVLDKLCNVFVDGVNLKSRSDTDDYLKGIKAVNACYNRGLEQRGHALTWDDKIKFYRWRDYPLINEKPYDEIHDFLEKEVIMELWLFKGMFKQWDVLNEPFDSNNLRKRFGTQIFSDMFQIASALDPTAKLFLNDTGMEGHQDRFAEKTMRANGLVNNIAGPMIENERAPIDGLGVQGHCKNYYYPQGFYQELDKLASLVDEVAVTEYDLYNEDHTYAPQHLRDTFLATYSHPKASAFVMWGYFDPMHWRGYGLFYDRQWNKRPEYYEWERILKEWLADSETAVTDENGRAVLRGLRGKYTVSVDTGDAKGDTRFTLTKCTDAERDNRIEAVVSADGVSFAHSNPTEFYSKGPVKYKDGPEAYANYLREVGDRELIGIYKKYDNNGNSALVTKDGLLNTYWYAENPGDYLEYELVKNADKGNVTVTFRAPNDEEYNYKILSSKDGQSWTEIYSGSSKENCSADFKDALFIRIQSVDNDYMGVSEVRIDAEK